MDVYATAVLISILVYIAVGNYAGRRVRHLEDYFVAGRRAPTLLIVGTLVASVLSTNAFLGETGFVYGSQAGSFILWPPIWCAGYIYGALYFGRYLRRSQALTVAEYFGQRFNSHRVRAAAGVTVVLGLGGYLLAVTQGSAVILTRITELDYTQALIVSWASYTAFTFYAGSRGVVITDTLMFLLFSTMSFVALIYLVDHHGGWLTALRGLVALEDKPDLMAWHGIVGPGKEWGSPTEYLIWGLIIGVGWSLVAAISPWQSSRYLMARNEHVVIRSACLAAIAVAAVQIMLFVAASTVNLSKSDIEPLDETMIWAALNILTPVLGALLLAGVMAAALSSATTFLSLVGFSLSNDIVRHEQVDEKTMLRLSRRMMLVVGGSALMIALFVPPDLFWLTYFVGPVFASSWGPVAFMSVWSERITADAAFWGIISGFLGNVIPTFVDFVGWVDLPVYLDPILVGGVISLVVILWVSRRGTVSVEEREYRSRLHQLPEAERIAGSTGKTVRTIWMMILFGVAMSAALMHWYVAPYQEATGTLDHGRLDWLSGEAIAAGGWAVILAILGLIALREIRRFDRNRNLAGKEIP